MFHLLIEIVASMNFTINFNLKTPSKQYSLIMCIIRVGGRQLRVSTQQNVLTESFDKVRQRCFTSKEKFSTRENKHCEEVNKILDEIVSITSRIYNSNVPDSDLFGSIHSAILDLTEIKKNERKEIERMTTNNVLMSLVSCPSVSAHVLYSFLSNASKRE